MNNRSMAKMRHQESTKPQRRTGKKGSEARDSQRPYVEVSKPGRENVGRDHEKVPRAGDPGKQQSRKIPLHHLRVTELGKAAHAVGIPQPQGHFVMREVVQCSISRSQQMIREDCGRKENKEQQDEEAKSKKVLPSQYLPHALGGQTGRRWDQAGERLRRIWFTGTSHSALGMLILP